MLADSNLLIYAAKPEYAGLGAWMAEHVDTVSAVSLVEVLGYHRMTPEALQLLKHCLHRCMSSTQPGLLST
jgi:hypothetical protein